MGLQLKGGIVIIPQGLLAMNRTAAVLLALLVALMPLAGCISDGVDGNDGAAGETGRGLPGKTAPTALMAWTA